ncbi:hypothetical protein BLOT_001891 [Blomia tropicalis]|nr:hypothetical protein BLOT_001891 [Blomia tropicalis]
MEPFYGRVEQDSRIKEQKSVLIRVMFVANQLKQTLEPQIVKNGDGGGEGQLSSTRNHLCDALGFD